MTFGYNTGLQYDEYVQCTEIIQKTDVESSCPYNEHVFILVEPVCTVSSDIPTLKYVSRFVIRLLSDLGQKDTLRLSLK